VKRTALKRKTPLRTTKSMPRRATGVDRALVAAGARKRKAGGDPAYLERVRRLTCLVGPYIHRCDGPIEAHHAGARPGVSLKAHDHTAVPLCKVAHTEWHAATGWAKGMNREDRRAWADAAIARTQARLLGAEVHRG
jgi:hypothetical protein